MRAGIRPKIAAAVGAASVALSILSYKVGSEVWNTRPKAAVAVYLLGLLIAFVPTLILTFSAIRAARMEERQAAIASLLEMVHRTLQLGGSHKWGSTDLRVSLLKVEKSSGAEQLRQVARFTCEGRSKPGRPTMSTSQGVAGRSCKQISTLHVNQVGDNFIEWMSNFGFDEEEARGFKPRQAYVCVPIVNEEGTPIGVLCLDAQERNSFTPRHVQLAEATVPIFGRLLSTAEAIHG